MKFVFAGLVTLAIAAVLGAGLLLAVRGNFWFLVVAGAAYLLAFARLGCLPRGTH